MKKLRNSFGAKLIGVILLIVFIATCLLSAFGISFLVSHNYYYDNGKSALNDAYSEIGEKYAKTVLYDYYPQTLTENESGNKSYAVTKYEDMFSSKKTNFSFSLYDESGKLLLRNFDCTDYSFSSKYTNTLILNNGSSLKMTVEYYIASPATAEDEFLYSASVNSIISSWRYRLIAIFAVGFTLGVILLVFLIYSIGCKRTADGSMTVSPSFIDKIPLDLFTVICVVIFIISLMLMPRLSYSIASTFVTAYLSALLWCLLILSFILTLSVRCKISNPLTKTLVFIFFRWLFKPERDVFARLRHFLNNLPLVWKAILIMAAVSLVEFIFLALGTRIEIFIFWIIEKLITIPIVLLILMNIRTLKNGIKKIANGDIDYKVDTRYLIWGFKEYGDGLNNINGAMQKIVDERMQSERLKTELITNVSHDIKTPLTSIVTYVDLLKNQHISPESAAQYVNVLDRQAKKLTKLINDLVDASKASTGNVTVNMEQTEAGVMLTQAAAEYDDKFKNANLTPVVSVPDNPTNIMADGRLLWRIFDNLLSNICKYSLPGTRVYLTVDSQSDKIRITFCNISKCPLNISSKELLERFVRGDSSRNTDGSGLGLSIAQSLTSLQDGKLDISIDGDLFKVVLSFDKFAL